MVFSSGAVEPLEMRSPHDLANFAEVLGVKSRDCVAQAPYRALQGNLLRRGSPQAHGS